MEETEDLQQKVVAEVCEGLAKKFEEIFIQGLEIKGYTFKDKKELTEFITESVYCVDDHLKQEKTYFVKNKPFLSHCYKLDFEPIIERDINTTITVNYGTYKFL